MGETHWKKLVNPNYLGSWDLVGQVVTATIKNITQEEIFNQTKQCKEFVAVAHFVESLKPMVLNKTNLKMMQTITGTPIVEKWCGAVIEIKTEKVRAFGKLEEGLRIFKPKPPKDYICADCKKKVTPVANFSAETIANTNQNTYGRILCAACSKKIKEELNKECENENN